MFKLILLSLALVSAGFSQTITNGGSSSGGTCSTCVTSAAPLPSNSIVAGAGSQAVSALSIVDSAVVVTSSSGVPSESTTLPTGLTMQTPASLTLTHATGLPVSTGITGLGTGVGTWLQTPSGANLGSALTSALPAGAGGTGISTASSSGFAQVTAGTWSVAALAASQIPAVNLPTPGSTCSTSGNSTFCVCTTTCTVTIPVPSAGAQFCAVNDDNVSTVITLAAIGSSSRYENTARTAYGTAGTGTLTSGGAVGDMVCIVGRDSTHYLTLTSKGTWTAS